MGRDRPRAARGGSSASPTRIAGQDRLATAVAASSPRSPYPRQLPPLSLPDRIIRRRAGWRTACRGESWPVATNVARHIGSGNRNRDQPGTQTWRNRLPSWWSGSTGAVGRIGNINAGFRSSANLRSGDIVLGMALAIATKLGNPSTIFEANGAGFADALSAVPAAIVKHGAILLTSGSTLSAATSAYVRAHPGLHYAVGGPAATADPSAIALVGADRYATSAAVALAIFPDITGLSVANGESFPMPLPRVRSPEPRATRSIGSHRQTPCRNLRLRTSARAAVRYQRRRFSAAPRP